MQLAISGFIAEEDGTGGSRVTQITDLSALGCKYSILVCFSASVANFILCSSLGARTCDQNGDREFDPQELGEDRSGSSRVRLSVLASPLLR